MNKIAWWWSKLDRKVAIKKIFLIISLILKFTRKLKIKQKWSNTISNTRGNNYYKYDQYIWRGIWFGDKTD